MAQQQNSSRSILIVTILVAIVLVAAIWPLSMIGKGGGQADGSDDVEGRIQPVAKLELAKAAARSSPGSWAWRRTPTRTRSPALSGMSCSFERCGGTWATPPRNTVTSFTAPSAPPRASA